MPHDTGEDRADFAAEEDNETEEDDEENDEAEDDTDEDNRADCDTEEDGEAEDDTACDRAGCGKEEDDEADDEMADDRSEEDDKAENGTETERAVTPPGSDDSTPRCSAVEVTSVASAGSPGARVAAEPAVAGSVGVRFSSEAVEAAFAQESFQEAAIAWASPHPTWRPVAAARSAARFGSAVASALLGSDWASDVASVVGSGVKRTGAAPRGLMGHATSHEAAVRGSPVAAKLRFQAGSPAVTATGAQPGLAVAAASPTSCAGSLGPSTQAQQAVSVDDDPDLRCSLPSPRSLAGPAWSGITALVFLPFLVLLAALAHGILAGAASAGASVELVAAASPGLALPADFVPMTSAEAAPADQDMVPPSQAAMSGLSDTTWWRAALRPQPVAADAAALVTVQAPAGLRNVSDAFESAPFAEDTQPTEAGTGVQLAAERGPGTEDRSGFQNLSTAAAAVETTAVVDAAEAGVAATGTSELPVGGGSAAHSTDDEQGAVSAENAAVCAYVAATTYAGPEDFVPAGVPVAAPGPSPAAGTLGAAAAGADGLGGIGTAEATEVSVADAAATEPLAAPSDAAPSTSWGVTAAACLLAAAATAVWAMPFPGPLPQPATQGYGGSDAAGPSMPDWESAFESAGVESGMEPALAAHVTAAPVTPAPATSQAWESAAPGDAGSFAALQLSQVTPGAPLTATPVRRSRRIQGRSGRNSMAIGPRGLEIEAAALA